jgi:lysozyme
MSASFSNEVLREEAVMLLNYSLWVAHYTNASNPQLPAPWTKWTFWQHTDKGTLRGIEGKVDLNWFNGSLKELQTLSTQ